VLQLAAVMAERRGKTKARLWQRPLRGNRLETFVTVDGTVMHIRADVATTDGMLALLEEHVGAQLPPVERRKPRYGRTRPRKQLAGQMSIEDAIAGLEVT
jgi:hypothetical protein